MDTEGALSFFCSAPFWEAVGRPLPDFRQRRTRRFRRRWCGRPPIPARIFRLFSEGEAKSAQGNGLAAVSASPMRAGWSVRSAGDVLSDLRCRAIGIAATLRLSGVGESLGGMELQALRE